MISIVVIDARKLDELETIVRKNFQSLPKRRFVIKDDQEIVLPFTPK